LAIEQAMKVKEIADGQIKTCTREEKGLDLVRRDWCGLSKKHGRNILNTILSGEDLESIVDTTCTYLTEQVF
jgi:DNA polymerase alpha subunit A